MRINYDGGGPRPSDKVKVGGVGGWEGHPDPEITGSRFSKKYLRPFGPQLGNNKGGGGEAPPLEPPLIFTYPTRNLWHTGP